MREFLQALLLATLFMAVGLFIGDYSKLRHEVAYINAQQQSDSSIEKEGDGNQSVNLPSAMNEKKKTDSISRNRKDEPPETYVLPVLNRSVKVADTAIILLTFSIALFTGGLLREEKDRSRKELRAYVGLENISFKINHWESTRGPNFSIYFDIIEFTVKNYGRTRANEVQVFFNSAKQFPLGPVSNFYHGTKVGKQMIHPGMEIKISPFSPPSPKEDFCYWGYIIYCDIYRQWWRTNFCYTHEADSNEFITAADRNYESGPHKTEQAARNTNPADIA
jgi:hypothetical protein